MAAREVDPGLGEIGLGRLLARGTGGDLGLQAGIVGEQRRDMALRVVEIGLRLCQRNAASVSSRRTRIWPRVTISVLETSTCCTGPPNSGVMVALSAPT